jgi:hypothetical protein
MVGDVALHGVDMLLSALFGVVWNVCPDIWGDGEQLVMADDDGASSMRSCTASAICRLDSWFLAHVHEWHWSRREKDRGWIAVHPPHVFLGHADR